MQVYVLKVMLKKENVLDYLHDYGVEFLSYDLCSAIAYEFISEGFIAIIEKQYKKPQGA